MDALPGPHELCTIGERIRWLRNRAGMHQPDMERELGVSAGTVSRWENGAHGVDSDRLVPLADLFGVDLRWLLTGETRPHERWPTRDDFRETREYLEAPEHVRAVIDDLYSRAIDPPPPQFWRLFLATLETTVKPTAPES